MDFLTFRKQLFPLGCFNVHQVLLHEKNFNRNNLTRWCRKGLIVKLRNEFYAFTEYLREPSFTQIIANRIYSPSYVSLHSALSFYGMIPEEVVQLTSVTTLKTTHFKNAFGYFDYQKLKTPFYFGYEIKLTDSGRGVFLATPEKALLDLLYLNPYYRSEQDMEDLRLDNDFMLNDFNTERMMTYLARFGSKALDKSVKCLTKVYEL